MLVVLCPSWPGEISDREIMASAPCRPAGPAVRGGRQLVRRRDAQRPALARRVAGVCSSMAAALGRELAALAAGRPTVWNLPATATAEEQLLAEMDTGRTPHRRCREQHREAGGARWRCWRRRSRPARPWPTLAVRWATRPASGGRCRKVLRLDQRWCCGILRPPRRPALTRVERISAIAAGAPIVALLGFPRPEEIECARQAGVAAVLSKPFLVADLAWQLAAVLAAPAER